MVAVRAVNSRTMPVGPTLALTLRCAPSPSAPVVRLLHVSAQLRDQLQQRVHPRVAPDTPSPRRRFPALLMGLASVIWSVACCTTLHMTVHWMIVDNMLSQP